MARRQPTQKFFQLSTEKDTTEINRGLRELTTGLATRSRHSGSHAKRATGRRQNSHVEQRAQPRVRQPQAAKTNAESEAQLLKLKPATHRILTKVLQQTGVGPAVDRVSSASESGQPFPNTRALGVFFSNINRSGSGNFLNPVTSRAGQLEGPPLLLHLPRRNPPRAKNVSIQASTDSTGLGRQQPQPSTRLQTNSNIR